MNDQLLNEEDGYLEIPVGDIKHNGIAGNLASPWNRRLSVSMPNMAISHLNLHQSSHLLSDSEEANNKSSLIYRIRLFLHYKLIFMREITSFDGLRFMSTDYSAKIRVPMWLAIFFISVVLLIWVLYFISIAYLDRNTFFTRTKHYPTSLNFPAITICNHNPYYDITVGSYNFYALPNETQVAIIYEYHRRDRLYDVNTSRLLEIVNNSFSFNIFTERFNKSVTLETILREHGHKLEYGLMSCSFDSREPPCDIRHFTEVVTAYGLCYTFNLYSNWSVSSAGISHGLSLVINIDQLRYMYFTSHTAGLQVFVHPQDEYPYSGEYNGFSVSPGFETQVAISLTNTKLMDPPYGQCGDRPIHDPYIFPCTTQSSNSAITNSTSSDTMMETIMKCPQPITRYTRQRCLDECEALYQNRRCGCKADYLPGGDIRVCNLNELFNCLLRVTDQFAEIKTSLCDCPVECNRTQYKSKLSQSYFPANRYLHGISQESIRNNYLSLLFYFDQLEYAEVMQMPEYSMLRYIADIGSHIGLFTGAGVLTFFELFELFF